MFICCVCGKVPRGAAFVTGRGITCADCVPLAEEPQVSPQLQNGVLQDRTQVATTAAGCEATSSPYGEMMEGTLVSSMGETPIVATVDGEEVGVVVAVTITGNGLVVSLELGDEFKISRVGGR